MGDVFGLLGRLLDGKYQVLSVVGEGGFGVVYRAQHRALGTPVALKVLKIPEDFTERARREFAQGFLAEAQTVARLQHPAVVRAIDFGVSTFPAGQNAPWTMFEWVEGQTLDAWCAARGGRPCAPAEALELLRPVFEALAFAHAQGIAHRDIKPPNIMVLAAPVAPGLRGHGPTTRVLDFGIAKAMQPDEGQTPSGATHTHSALAAFSLPYAAPEQATAMRTGPWTDVHALALVLTELLVGRRPYVGEDKLALAAAVLSPRRPTPATLGVDVGGWEAVLARALAFHPAERYPDAATFLAALDAAQPTATPAIASTVVMASIKAPVPWVPSPRATTERVRPPTRRAAVVAASVGVTLLLAAAAYGLLRPSNAAPPPAVATDGSPPDMLPSPAVLRPPIASPPREAPAALQTPAPEPITPEPPVLVEPAPEPPVRTGARRPPRRAPRQVSGVPLERL